MKAVGRLRAVEGGWPLKAVGGNMNATEAADWPPMPTRQSLLEVHLRGATPKPDPGHRCRAWYSGRRAVPLPLSARPLPNRRPEARTEPVWCCGQCTGSGDRSEEARAITEAALPEQSVVARGPATPQKGDLAHHNSNVD